MPSTVTPNPSLDADVPRVGAARAAYLDANLVQFVRTSASGCFGAARVAALGRD